MKVPKGVQRMLVGAGLGALVGSGRLQETGTKFLDALLKPMMSNKLASEYVGRVVYEAFCDEVRKENATASAKRWMEMPPKAKEGWCRIGTAAIKAVAHMVSQAIAGNGQ